MSLADEFNRTPDKQRTPVGAESRSQEVSQELDPLRQSIKELSDRLSADLRILRWMALAVWIMIIAIHIRLSFMGY